MSPITRETIIERRQTVFRWSPVFAGAAVAFGIWALLQTLGLGVGLVVLEPQDLSRRDLCIAGIVWTFATPLIALFLGGLVAGRLGMTRDRKLGSLHGLVVWALTAVLGIATTVVAVGAFGAIHLSRLAMHATNAAGEAGAPTVEPSPGSLSTAGWALLFTGLGLLASLIAATLGGAAGVHRDRRPPAAIVETVETVETR